MPYKPFEVKCDFCEIGQEFFCRHCKDKRVLLTREGQLFLEFLDRWANTTHFYKGLVNQMPIPAGRDR